MHITDRLDNPEGNMIPVCKKTRLAKMLSGIQFDLPVLWFCVDAKISHRAYSTEKV